MILDEFFPEHHKLYEAMEVEPTPITLLCLPSLELSPSSSGQKRSRANAAGEGKMEDTDAFGSGTHPAT